MSGNFPFGAAPVLGVNNFPAILCQRVVAVLKQLNTLAGQYVDDTRAIPVGIDDAPRIAVYIAQRSYVWKGDSAPQYDAIGRLTVIGYVTDADHGVVVTNTETLGASIMSLMGYLPLWAAPEVERVTGIEVSFDVTADGDRYEGTFVAEFSVKWTETYEPVLAPLPDGYGAVGAGIDLTVETMTGETLTGAIIPLATS